MNFPRLAKAHHLSGNLLKAVRMVLVEGLTAYAASQAADVDKSQLSKRLAKIRAAKGKCPCCEQEIN